MTPSYKNNPIYLKFKTPHYSFNLTLTKTDSKIYDTYYFLVGENDNPCLEGHITLENKTNLQYIFILKLK